MDLIDFAVAEGKIPLWTQIASKDFLTSLLGVLKTRDAPEVQQKILYLIKKWGTRFESYKEILPNFFEFYKNLKSTGSIIFPENYNAEYLKYTGVEEESYKINNKTAGSYDNKYDDDFNVENKNYLQKKSSGEIYREEESDGKSSFSNSKRYNVDLNANNYDKKYSKLIGKLSIWFENVLLANEMIDSTKVGSSIDDGLKFVIDNLREAEGALLVYIQEKVKNEKVLELCLGINDDINKTVTRYDVIRSKAKPEPFSSIFEEKNSHNNKKSGNKHVGRANSRSPNRTGKENIPNDPFDVFQLNSEINNISPKKKDSSLNKQMTNLKSVDDIFEIFGGNMTSNPEVSSSQIKNVSTPVNKKNSQTNFNFGESFPVLTNNINLNLNNNNNNLGFSGNNTASYNEPGFNTGLNNNNNNTNFADNNQGNYINYDSNFSFSGNHKPGIDSLSEKLKNAYNATDEVDQNLNPVYDRRISNQNVGGVGVRIIFI